MKNEDFEKILKQSLEYTAKDIQASPYMLQKIKAEANSKTRKERFYMKLLETKKIALIGILCFASVTCFAAAKLNGVVSHSNNKITSIEGMADAENEVGFSPKYVEAFDNGFVFSQGGTGETHGTDSNGNPTGKTYKTINITYLNDENKWVALGIENGSPYTDNGIEVSEGYSSQMYKFVPPDYTLTDEDKKAQDDGSLMISYGSEKVEINNMENYSWEENGLYYSLTASDCNLGEEAMKHMAEQVMNQ